MVITSVLNAMVRRLIQCLYTKGLQGLTQRQRASCERRTSEIGGIINPTSIFKGRKKKEAGTNNITSCMSRDMSKASYSFI